MLAGIRFNQLKNGDPLADKNWSYNNLWGIYATREKLIDQFKFADDIGFKIIYDTICPTFDLNGNLTLDNNGENGDIWPLYSNDSLNRIDIYKEQILKYNFKFICEIEFPEYINKNNIDKFSDFFIKLISNPSFNWIKYWQISNTPETLIYDSINKIFVPKTLPEDYVNFLNKIRTTSKLLNPDINIGGPGIYKSLGLLDSINDLYSDKTFYHQWLSDAINFKLLNNIDFFSVQLRQDTNGLISDNIQNLILSLNGLISKYLDKELPIYSIYQGRQELNKNSLNDLKNQTYYMVSDMLTASKNNVIPIINCMTDICDNLLLNPNYNKAEDGYGICRYDMSKKPQYETFKFILNHLKDYSQLTSPNKIYNTDNNNIKNISFLSENKDNIISVIWSKNKIQQKIVLLQNTDEYYITQTDGQHKIINPVEWETSTDFLIVIQYLNLSIVDYDDIKSKLFKLFMYYINFRKSLLDSVPNGYNKNEHMNFYKILRAFALEFADAEVQVDILKDDAYLNTAHDTAIYQNFGTLVDLEKQSDWDYEQYRSFIKGIIKSLLKGSTVNSIEEAMNLFVNYDNINSNGKLGKIADIKIHELYNDKTLDPVVYSGIYPQFVFVVEVNRDIMSDVKVNQENLNRDLQYIVNILKPAHTLSFIVVVLSGSEDYKKWFYEKGRKIGKNGLPVQFQNSDEFIIEGELGGKDGIKEGKYGWKHKHYSGQFHTYDPNNKHFSKLNGGILIGPRYILNNSVSEIVESYNSENINTLNIDDFESSNIRYGYYKDNQDSLSEPQKDNLIPYNSTKINPDYFNPDSGEYYKNWWLKYHKKEKRIDVITRLGTTSNIVNEIENQNYVITLTTDLNKNVKLENINYIEKDINYKEFPFQFTMNKTVFPIHKIDKEYDISYNIKYSTATMGGSIDSRKYIYKDSEINYKQLNYIYLNNKTKLPINNASKFKYIGIYNEKNETSFLGGPILVENRLWPEVNTHYKSVIINSNKNDIELGNLPYNNINQRPYQDNVDGKFYFEDMDQQNTAIETDEHKFGENAFMYTMNKCIFPINLPSQPTKNIKPFAYGCTVRDQDISAYVFKMLPPMFTLNKKILPISYPTTSNGYVSPLAFSREACNLDLTDAEFAARGIIRVDIKPLTHVY